MRAPVCKPYLEEVLCWGALSALCCEPDIVGGTELLSSSVTKHLLIDEHREIIFVHLPCIAILISC